MSRTSDRNEVGQGDVPIWDELWKTVGVDNLTHYTKGRPETVFQLENRGHFEGILSDLFAFSSASCVELGAGRGNQALYLTAAGAKVTMVDLSDEGFAVARQNFSREGLSEPTMIIADVRETGIPTGATDMVYSIGLLEHFEDPVPVLEESHRILKPGGILRHIVVPENKIRNRWLAMLALNPVRFVSERIKSAVKRLLRYPPRLVVGTVTGYGVEEYATWMAQLGFEDVVVVPIGPYHPVHLSAWPERHVAMPIYRMHYAFKRRQGRSPNLATWPSIARGLLVSGKKPETDAN